MILIFVGLLVGAGWLFFKWGANDQLLSRDLFVATILGIGPIILGLNMFDGPVRRRRTRD